MFSSGISILNSVSDHSIIPVNLASVDDAVLNTRDSFGKLVWSMALYPDQKNIKLNNKFSPGLYVYSIVSSGKVLSVKKMQVL